MARLRRPVAEPPLTVRTGEVTDRLLQGAEPRPQEEVHQPTEGGEHHEQDDVRCCVHGGFPSTLRSHDKSRRSGRGDRHVGGADLKSIRSAKWAGRLYRPAPRNKHTSTCV